MPFNLDLSGAELEDLVGLTEAEGTSQALLRATSVAVVDINEDAWHTSDAVRGRVTLYVNHGVVARAVNG